MNASKWTFRALVLATLLGGASPAIAESPLSTAQTALSRGDYERAEDLLKSASGPEADLLRAELALYKGKYDEAGQAASKASAGGPEIKARAAELRARALAATGKYDAAINALRNVESLPEARRARLLLGELLIHTGKRADARDPLMTIIQDYNSDAITSTDAEGLSLVGRAAHLLRSPADANDAFNEAERAGASDRVETLLWRAELFLEKYDPGHAAQVVDEAAKLAPQNPDVRIALARVALENAMDFDEAESQLRQALEVNPNLTSAHFVKAGLALRDLDIERADEAADQGLKINPNDLELLSMKAAIRFLDDDAAGFERFKKKVLTINPTYTQFYEIVGEYAEWEHRYDEIIEMMQEAVKLDPGAAKAHAVLGLNLIRAGREDEGLASLREAWKKDKYNVRVYNTLNLYEKDIATQYVTVQGQVFRIRYHKDEQKMLERYVPQMLEEAWGSMVKRYGFTPKTPVTIELYANPEHFSVRTSGLPNVGIQGVCFGQTLAQLSPYAAAFNWGNILWHELGHVFALQQSKNHVPRWFTEGLSEYETIVQRDEWQREEDPALYAAFVGERVPRAEHFNAAFTHVDSVEEVTMAYYAASQLVVYIIDAFGFEKVPQMLAMWGDGKRSPEVIRTALGIEPAELDRRFRDWLEKKYAGYEKQYVPDLHAPPLDEARQAVEKAPRDARKHVELALALLRSGNADEGKATLQHALALDDKHPDALYVQARLQLTEENFKGAKGTLQKMAKAGDDGFGVQMLLADIAAIEEKDDAMKAALERAHQFDPSQPEPLQGLVDLAVDRKDGIGEIENLRKLALLDQHDRRVWVRLLDGLVARGEWQEAVKVGESAIYIDVHNPEVHRLYARALARTGNHVSAVHEYNSAIIAGPEPEALVGIYEQLGYAYDSLGKKEYAERARAYMKDVRGKMN